MTPNPTQYLTDYMKKKYCLFCKKELGTNPRFNTSAHRTDGYCTAKCKRKDRNEYYRDLDKSRPCDPDTGWF